MLQFMWLIHSIRAKNGLFLVNKSEEMNTTPFIQLRDTLNPLHVVLSTDFTSYGYFTAEIER